MTVNIEEIQKMEEQEQLLYIDRFLNSIGINASDLNLKRKLKILKNYIQSMKNDIYCGVFYMSNF